MILKNFTPCLDTIIQRYEITEKGFRGRGLKYAAVYGKIYRYEHMKDGTCKASQNRIADELGLTRQVVNEACLALEGDGYIRRIDGGQGKPIEWVTTSKAGLELGAYDDLSDLSSERTTLSSERTTPVTPAYTNKEVKKEVNKQLGGDEETFFKIVGILQGLGWFYPNLSDMVDTEIEKWDEFENVLDDQHALKGMNGHQAVLKAAEKAKNIRAKYFSYIAKTLDDVRKDGAWNWNGKTETDTTTMPNAADMVVKGFEDES